MLSVIITYWIDAIHLPLTLPVTSQQHRLALHFTGPPAFALVHILRLPFNIAWDLYFEFEQKVVLHVVVGSGEASQPDKLDNILTGPQVFFPGIWPADHY